MSDIVPTATDAPMIPVVDLNGNRLSPCRPEKAEQNLRDGLATWRDGVLYLNYRPLAYRRIHQLVRDRDRLVCAWCHGVGSTLDHVIPVCWGGRTSLNNCVIACRACNHSRNNALPSTFIAWTGYRPTHPVIRQILHHEQDIMASAERSLGRRPIQTCISKEEAQVWVAYHHGGMDRVRALTPKEPWTRFRPDAKPFEEIFVP